MDAQIKKQDHTRIYKMIHRDADTHIHIYTYIHIYTHIYQYV